MTGFSLVLGTKKGRIQGSSLAGAASLAALVGYELNLLGRTSFVGLAGPVPQPAATIFTLLISGIVAYLSGGIIVGWIAGLGIYGTTAIYHTIFVIGSNTPVSFIIDRLIGLALGWGILFSTLGFAITLIVTNLYGRLGTNQ